LHEANGRVQGNFDLIKVEWTDTDDTFKRHLGKWEIVSNGALSDVI
jgi:hypothetical protein